MSIGVVILAHEHLHRTRQLAAALAGAGLLVGIHVDGNAPKDAFDTLVDDLGNHKSIHFVPRIKCEWGKFSLVKAGLGAAKVLLDANPNLSHVIQISGACLPTRPLNELKVFLAARPGTDFVESTPMDQPWVQDGLGQERFQYYFPFSWKRHRWLFDRSVDFQRRFKIRRRIPSGLEPHLGSQWWCLSAATLRGILEDPHRAQFDRYFEGTWIPDESYVPTLVRRHSKSLVDRSLTLARFDDQGKPHVFYDDHGDLLAGSEYFFARKIWHGANKLYRRFLHLQSRAQPRSACELDAVFRAARERRCAGRAGIRNAGRFPAAAYERQPSTAAPYTVLIGFGQVFDGFHHWLGNTTGSTAHGRVFQSDRVVFSSRWRTPPAGLEQNAAIRDSNPEQFLTNMLWSGRDQTQSLMFEIADSARMAAFFARDPNARIIAVQGAWLLDLFQRRLENPGVLRAQARRLADAWADFEGELVAAGRAARFSVVPLARVTHSNANLLTDLQAEICPDISLRPRALPPQRSLDGLDAFLKRLQLMGITTSGIAGQPSERRRLGRLIARV